MNTEQARAIVKETFPQAFDKGRFRQLAVNLLNHIDESKAQAWNTTFIKDAFKDHVKGYERLGTYTSPDKEKLDVLIVNLTAESKLQRTRTAIRNFVADHLKTRDGKDAALVAFVSPSEQKSWRFSYVKMEYAAVEKADGKVGVQTKLTPARRSSYIVGEGESCHTAQSRFLDLLQDTENLPTLAQIEDAFSVEAVTKEFFEQYKALFLDLKDDLDDLAQKDKTIGAEFAAKNVSTADFGKKLMGQIVFLYFLQKKGWLGVPKGKDWGDGPHNFLRQLFAGKFGGCKNFFNDILEPLFYDTLATDRGHEAWCKIFNCRIPFLNGGLFEPVAGYDWQKTNILIPNSLFSNTKTTSAGDVGTGILDVFDRYNFTVNEAEPLEKEVAIDPEMLGKVFENLLEVKERKSKGSFYTPREIVHYMCQESLINYLDTAVNSESETVGTERRKQAFFGDEKAEQTLLTAPVRKEIIPRADLETFIHSGDQASYYEAARVEGTSYQRKLPKTIETHARLIDDKLADIAVCDPAIGSGAFPVGMMQEIVRARSALTPYFNDVHERTAYHFKRHAIQYCIYGVDIDPGAVEIAKLRLWLSLVVDEDDVKQIKPLPNLDYKIVVGNSLLGVEKNELANWQAYHRLEKLKPSFFDEADGDKKHAIKREIDGLIHNLTDGIETFDFEVYFSEVFQRKGGFDIIVVNPPYVGEKGNEFIFQEVARTELGKKYYTRWMDYFYFFFHKALDIGRSKSSIAFITTNYFLTATGAKYLRADFSRRSTITNIINFNELKIFDSAKGQHNAITILRKDRDEALLARNAITMRNGQASQYDLARVLGWSDLETHYINVKQDELYEGNDKQIRMAGFGAKSGDPDAVILEKLKADSYLLGKICDVLSGVVSLADKVSPSHLKKYPETKGEKGDGILVLTTQELKKLNLGKDEVAKFVRPFFKNSDIDRYSCKTKNTLWLLRMKDEGQPIVLSESLKEHFERFKVLLVKGKENFLKNAIAASFVKRWLANGNYFVMLNPKEEYYFTQPKIIAPYRSKTNTFAYNESPWYASKDVSFILSKKGEFNLKYILGLLNSKLYYLWLYRKGKRKGNTLELYIRPLSEIPIKRISPVEQEPFIKLVDRILLAKQRDAGADVSALEREIDELVYALYALTPAEIDLVKGAAK
jgi:type I restriction-modification system DNA methylase subunit